MQRIFIFSILFACFLFLTSALIWKNFQDHAPSQPLSFGSHVSSSSFLEQDLSDSISFHQETVFINKNSNVLKTLLDAGLDRSLAHQLVDSISPFIDLRQMAYQTPIVITRTFEGMVVGLEFVMSKIKSLSVAKDSFDSWQVSWSEKQIHIEKRVFSGEVTSSLWESATQAGLPAHLISKLADIFAWQIDFDREIKLGDRWELVVEEKFADGKPYGLGEVLLATYWASSQMYTAVRFEDKNGQIAYYTKDGESLKASFLKSPLKFTRISSRFQKERYHPVLGVSRPHNGVDYAAPTGTPVYSVADGMVSIIGRKGGSGKMIEIRHNGIYKTAYKHLNGFAASLKLGDRVSQGQVIGYVGMTGLATGPHLHFEFYENGVFKDPLGKKFPKTIALDEADRQKLTDCYEKLLAFVCEEGADHCAPSNQNSDHKKFIKLPA